MIQLAIRSLANTLTLDVYQHLLALLDHLPPTLPTSNHDTCALHAEVRVLDLKSGHTHSFFDDPLDREPSWIGEGHRVVWLSDTGYGMTDIRC